MNDDERDETTFVIRKCLAFTQNLDQHNASANPTVSACSPVAQPPLTSSIMPTIIVNESSHVQPVSSSTPIQPCSKQPEQSATPVSISVQYPSKTVKKVLSSDFEMLGKALIHGPPSRIAKAVMKCKPINKLVIKQVLLTVSNEVRALCSRKNPSLLRQVKKDNLVNFNIELLCQEWEKRAPLSYAFFLTCSSSGKTGQSVKWYPSIGIAGSTLLKQRNNHMSATAIVLGLLVKTRSIEVAKF